MPRTQAGSRAPLSPLRVRSGIRPSPTIGRVVHHAATRRGVHRLRGRDQTLGRWGLGLLGVVLLAAGGLSAITATASGSGAVAAAEGDAAAAAQSAASRLSAWTAEVGSELNDYAAAIVLDSTATRAQLGSFFQTLLTQSRDFWLLELTNPLGEVTAASDGAGLAIAGAPWLSELSATPLLTPIRRSNDPAHPIQWIVARRATAGGVYSGFLVGALQASQVANLLSPATPAAAMSTLIQAVLPGGVLLYRSTMTTTAHAGLTDASMVAAGALGQRVTSTAATAALNGETGTTGSTVSGVESIAGYASVALPGWEIAIVATERVASTPPDLLQPIWWLAGLAALAGIALLGGALVTGRGGAPAGLPVGPGSPARGRLPVAVRWPRRGITRRGRGVEPHPAASLPSPDAEVTTVGRPSSGAGAARSGGRRRLRGRYEILEVTGSGGEGEVLRALDHMHSRQVAIKVRSLGTVDTATRRAILNEASVLLRMTPHAHASMVREDFILGDRYYLIMDWIDGTPLNRMLAESGTPGLPVERVMGWMGQVAEVLDHLHAHSPVIVHGDVKPSNVIVTPGDEDSRAILVDFGISQGGVSPRDDMVEPAGRGAMGSPGFMAPEVLLGARPGSAADVFGLAATTLMLLLGRPAP
jgi:hypothetical protein